MAQHEYCTSHILQINRLLSLLVDLLSLAFDPRQQGFELRLVLNINLPCIEVETWEIDVDQSGVLLDQLEKVLSREYIFVFVEVVVGEQETGILFGQTRDVGLYLEVSSDYAPISYNGCTCCLIGFPAFVFVIPQPRGQILYGF